MGKKKNIQENSQKTLLKLSSLHAEQSAGAPDTFKHKVRLPSKVTVSAEIQKTKSAKNHSQLGTPAHTHLEINLN